MGEFILRRLLLSVLILFFVMLIVYTLMFSLPTSYVENMARELATKPGSLKSTADWMADLNSNFGFDKGIIGGYFHWISNAVSGEFGESWNWSVPVVDQFNAVIWNSFILSAVSFFVTMIISIPAGVIAARKQYSVTDYTVTVTALIGISMPTFFTATLLKLIFAIKLGWFEISGMQGRNFHLLQNAGDTWGMFLDRAAHFVLPALTLIIVSIGSYMRFVRTNMLEVLNSDYIRTARAKGLSERRVINRHAFRNTLIPLITILGGSLPGLFSGALITETLFAFNGIGYTSYQSMISGDIPFTMFYLMFISVLTLLGNLISDILYAVVDPRVRVN